MRAMLESKALLLYLFRRLGVGVSTSYPKPTRHLLGNTDPIAEFGFTRTLYNTL